MGFAVWIDKELTWAQGTHEYRPMGSAVIARSDLFRIRDFSRFKRPPGRLAKSYVGLFGSLEDVNQFLRSQDIQKKFSRRESFTRSII